MTHIELHQPSTSQRSREELHTMETFNLNLPSTSSAGQGVSGASTVSTVIDVPVTNKDNLESGTDLEGKLLFQLL